jgi:hypothetical protein
VIDNGIYKNPDEHLVWVQLAHIVVYGDNNEQQSGFLCYSLEQAAPPRVELFREELGPMTLILCKEIMVLPGKNVQRKGTLEVYRVIKYFLHEKQVAVRLLSNRGATINADLRNFEMYYEVVREK